MLTKTDPTLPPLRTLLILSTCALVAATSVAAEFRGKLDPQAKMGTRGLSPVVAASPDIIAALPTAPGTGDKVWMLSRPLNIKGKNYLLAIVATAAGEKTLWLDRNGDGKFSDDERWPFPNGKKELSLTLPWDNGIYREFPICFEYATEPFRHRPATGAAPAVDPPPAAPLPTTVASLSCNFNIVFNGTVDVDGQPVRVMFAPCPDDLAIDPANQRVSLDANCNGRFEPDLGEVENRSGKLPVFRVGTRFLAVKSADVKTGEIVLEERPASDYTRFAAEPGQQMPDFAFVDFAGGRHKLSDYRGKVVLLDFWGTWCVPCTEEMKLLDPLYEKYHARGFEIISMNMEHTSGKLTAAEYSAVNKRASAFIAKAGHPWLQATQESIERFALDVIHVNCYPTCILIGADGKVISRNAHSKTLAALLAEHLP